MYVLIGKEKCNQCNILKNLLDEKGIQYHYVDLSKIPQELLTYLRMYCNTYPIVLGVKYFSTFNETLWNILMTFELAFFTLYYKNKKPLTNSH